MLRGAAAVYYQQSIEDHGLDEVLSLSQQFSLLKEEFKTKECTLLLNQELHRLTFQEFVRKNPSSSLYDCTTAFIQRMTEIWHAFPSAYLNIPDLMRSRILNGVRDFPEFEHVLWVPPDTLQGLYRRLTWAASTSKSRPHQELSSHVIPPKRQTSTTDAVPNVNENIIGRMKQYADNTYRSRSPRLRQRSQSPRWDNRRFDSPRRYKQSDNPRRD